MDFADATLVVLAEELNTDLVFTVDRDFMVYRIRGRKHFRVVDSIVGTARRYWDPARPFQLTMSVSGAACSSTRVFIKKRVPSGEAA